MDGFELIQKDDFEGFKEYIKYNNVNSINNKGQSLLIQAVRFHQIEMLRLLLEAGAKINKANKDGDTPLHIACFMGQIDIVQILIFFKANIEVENHNGERPLFLAVKKNAMCIVKLLLEHGAKIDTLTKSKENMLFYALRSGSLEMIELFYKKGIYNINKQNDILESLMHVACKQNSYIMVEWLLQHRMKYFMKNKNQESPLFYAATFSSIEINQVLINAGLSLEAMNAQGHTVIDCVSNALVLDCYKHVIDNPEYIKYLQKNFIFYAIQNNDLKSVKSVLNEQGVVQQKNQFGFTPLDFALETKNRDIIKMLDEKRK